MVRDSVSHRQAQAGRAYQNTKHLAMKRVFFFFPFCLSATRFLSKSNQATLKSLWSSAGTLSSDDGLFIVSGPSQTLSLKRRSRSQDRNLSGSLIVACLAQISIRRQEKSTGMTWFIIKIWYSRVLNRKKKRFFGFSL